MIVLLLLVAVVVTLATAIPKFARGSGAPDLTPDLVRRLGRRFGALLLVVVGFLLLAGEGEAQSSATYAAFAGGAAIVMVALGAFWMYRDRETADSK